MVVLFLYGLYVSSWFFFFPMTFEGYGLHSLFPSVQSKTNDSSNLNIFGKFTWLLPTFSEMTFTLLHPALTDMAFLSPREKENHFPLPLKKGLWQNYSNQSICCLYWTCILNQKSNSNNRFGCAVQSVTLPCLHQADFMAKKSTVQSVPLPLEEQFHQIQVIPYISQISM